MAKRQRKLKRNQKRDEDIIFELWDGTSIDKISKMFGLSWGRIYHLAREYKIPSTTRWGIKGGGRPESRLKAPPASFDVLTLRKKLGVSRRVFAQKIGASVVSVFNWEVTGTKPRKEFIIRMRRLAKRYKP